MWMPFACHVHSSLPPDQQALPAAAAADSGPEDADHSKAAFPHQDVIEAEVQEKRAALAKMKVALGNAFEDSAAKQMPVPHDFGYTPSQGGRQ